MNRFKAISIGLLLLVAAGSLHADEPWKKYGMILPETVAAHRKELGVSADQEAKIGRLLVDALAEADRLSTTLAEQQKKFDEMMSRPDVSLAEGSAALAKAMEAEAAVNQFQFKALLNLRDQLTTEQQAKARQLPEIDAAEAEQIKLRVEEKGNRLRQAFETVQIAPPAIEIRGRMIGQLVQSGMVATAEWALDQLITDTCLDAPSDNAAIDFTRFDPGSIDLPTLQDRYAAVQEKAKQVVSLPTLRKLMKARDEFEQAKSAEDVVRVGRVLTFAEGLLKSK